MEEEFEYLEDQAAAKAGRRSFLSAALATVTVAAVTGGTAALLLEESDGQPQSSGVTRPPATLPSASVSVNSDAGADASYLKARLTALESENSALKGDLSAARRQLASYGGASAESAAGDDWRQQFEEASAQATDLAGNEGKANPS